MRKKQVQEGKFIPLAISFVCIVVALVAIYFLSKLISVVSQSSFDGRHQFIVAVQSEDSNSYLLVFNPQDTTSQGFVYQKNSLSNIILPTDARVVEKNTISPGISFNDLVKKIAFGGNTSGTTLNVLDGYKLYLLARSASFPNSLEEVPSSISPDDFTKKFGKNFLDKQMYQEAKTIGIVNASGISGMGNKLSQMLTFVGANVISVTTDDSEKSSTRILYSGDTTYTLSRLQRILSIQAEKSSNPVSVADITVIIGKDITSVISE